MKRQLRPRPGVAFLMAALCMSLAPAGCDYSAPPSPTAPGGVSSAFPAEPAAPGASAPAPELARSSPAEAPPPAAPVADEPVEGKVILENVINLVQTASLKPGGDNFGIATKNLNQYFERRASAADYKIGPEARAFLLSQLDETAVQKLELPAWTFRDARHLEDCMLYHRIAARVAGTGDDLARVRRTFEWVVRNIQLVPPGALGSGGLQQAQARPYDVLMRGMGTEAGGFWSERGWLFLALCRQLGVDAAMVTYTPPRAKEPVVWLCAVLVEGKAYLFDPRIGLPVPGPDGRGVATLDQAATDGAVLDRLDLPGQSSYSTTGAVLRGSPTKIGILIDSSLGYVAPRMKLLQRELAGKNRTILYRDPAELRDNFARALGPRLGSFGFWELPLMVDTLLFTNPKFVESTQRSLVLFDSKFPLLHARVKQLQGDIAGAIQEYVALRFAEGAMQADRKAPIPPEVQRALDVYATYYLGLANLEQDNPKQAEFFFRETLRLLPAPGRGQPYYYMFRWGAQANLGRLAEARGDLGEATAYFAQFEPTAQYHGNLLRARDLVWLAPLGPPPAPLPPAPPAAPAEPAAQAFAP